jgi:hypothetical protein
VEQIRNRVLVEGASRRRVIREENISHATLIKMLANPTPPSPIQGQKTRGKIGPYLRTIEKVLTGRTDGRPPTPIEASKILARIRRDGTTAPRKRLSSR